MAREIRRRDDRLKTWVDRHRNRCVQAATNENVAELSRIVSEYASFLGSAPNAADPLVICMALYYRDAGWLVLTDDSGIQVVCVLEGVQYLTSTGFCTVEGI